MEEKKPYEVATTEASPVMLMIRAMKDGGMDLAALEKMMELQDRFEKTQARKAYTQAMSDFKKSPPEIEKDRHVEFKTSTGKTEYNHASLGNVTAKINTALGACGLSAAWTTEQSDKGVSVTCKITHVLGHFETTMLTAACDSSGGKNPIQALGSTISYLQRYSLLCLTGLATHEIDTDGMTQEEKISDAHKSTILDFINSKGINQSKFLLYMGFDSVDDIPESDYQKALASVKAAKGTIGSEAKT